jgi:serine phosphatase RsbU (regulator of sigma subunit)
MPSSKGITRRVMVALYATLAVLCTVVILLAHLDERRRQRQAMVDRLGTATATLAAQVGHRHISELLRNYPDAGTVIKHTQDARYYVLHDHLRRSTERLGLEQPLRLLVRDERTQRIVELVTAADRPNYRAPVAEPIALAILGQGSHAHGGLQAHEPVLDDTGATVAWVVAEASDSEAAARSLGILWRNIAFGVVLLVFAGIALFTSVGRMVRREENEHQALLARHTDVTDAIAYAADIQRALVPPPSAYDDIFGEAFVLNRPKDLVSGDLHWLHRTDDGVVWVAAADCTGHGLPGALIAAVGCSLLNELVPQHADEDPAAVLERLHERWASTLRQQGRTPTSGDGMELALCRIDRAQGTILFAGARRPLYWLHRGRVTVINGDRRPVGGNQHDHHRRFTCHRLAYHPGDRIYLCSDGYADQPGGLEGRRFMTARLVALLQEHQALALHQQRDLLERLFDEWKGHRAQVDDVCMLGIAV